METLRNDADRLRKQNEVLEDRLQGSEFDRKDLIAELNDTRRQADQSATKNR